MGKWLILTMISDTLRAFAPSGRCIVSWASSQGGLVLSARAEDGMSQWDLIIDFNRQSLSLCKRVAEATAAAKPLT